MSHAHTARAAVALRDPRAIAEKLARHLAGHGAKLRDDAQGWQLDFGHRQARIDVTPQGLDLLAKAQDGSLLHEMQLDLAEHLAEFGGPDQLDWQGAAPRSEPPNFRLMTVESIRDLTPTMRRLRLQGPELLRFDSMAALHVKLLLPPPGHAPVWPRLDARGRFQPGNGLVRKYTIRALDVAQGWMDVDFLIHQPAGPGSGFAAAVRPGDRLGLIGPGGGGIRLQGPILLLGDETALPAIARALEAMPEGTQATACIEIAGPGEEQPIALRPGSRVDWLHRGASPPGTRLVEALIAAAPDAGTLVWAGCEFAAFKAIRNHLRGPLAHPRDRHLITAYWRAGRPGDRI